MGPDDIPNEVFKHADNTTIEIYQQVLNRIMKNQTTPPQWQKGIITRLYKGKGKKGMCSNERGITVSSNVGKVYERIINNRAQQHVIISHAQAGGKEGRSTTDHLLLLKDIISLQKKRGKPLLLTYLDVTKAYDKAWSDGIMYALHNNGVTGDTWNIIRKLSQNLCAQIKTKDGLTREIKIKDSIRQGGVLSVLQYATVMDEIAKEIQKLNKGIKIPHKKERIGCLLWMDDVLLMADNEKDLMIMKKKPQLQTQLKLGEMKIKTTENYKYLGEIINHKKTTQNQIDEAKRKAEGALQTIFTIAGDPILRGIQMETIWKLIDSCIIPIITYGSELWNPNKQETKQIDQVLDNIIKRILMVPTSTPREATYIETGLKDMESNRTQKRINMMNRIEKNKNNLISTITDIDNNQNWKNITIQTMEKIGLTTDELKKLTTKHQQKKRVTGAIERDFKNRIPTEPQTSAEWHVDAWISTSGVHRDV